MKKRPIWMGCLLAAMICSVFLFRRMDNMRFCGLQMKSGEKLRQLTENLSDAGSLRNVEKLIELDGKTVPYDRFHNTFYVSQSTKTTEYAGTFHVTGEECSVYLEEDAALQDKQKAIAEAHVFRLWFVTKEDYVVADLIFTGIPLISIHSDAGGLTESYGRGNMVVQNPDDEDVITMSIKDSAIQAKTNYGSGTISFKLYKENDQEERNLNLLGLGKHTSWKLYQVHERDDSAFREMLASYVWNCVCEDEELRRDMEYAEVIVDGEYKGLYYLAPKLGKGYLNLSDEDRLYKADRAEGYEIVGDEDSDRNRQALEEYLSLWNDEKFDQINIENYMDYHIWMQTVCGVQCGREDYCIIAYEDNGLYEFYRMPERSKFVFGIYPSEIGWQSLTAAEAVIEDAAYEKLAEASDHALERELAGKWRELRNGGLDTESMQQYAAECEREMIKSGYIAREGNQEEYEADCFEVREFVKQRMDYLDNWYGYIE